MSNEEKEKLIKYLEEMIDWTTKSCKLNDEYNPYYNEAQKIGWWLVQERKEILNKIKGDNYE